MERKDMKEIIAFTIAMVFLFGSCNKEENPAMEKMVEVTIGYKLVESNSMYATRATQNETILNCIAQCIPADIPLTLRNSSGETISVTTGVPTELPVGVYTVTGTFRGNQIGEPVYERDCIMTDRPYITIEDRITITSENCNYTVSASYKSFAIVVDYDEVTSATYKAASGDFVELNFQRFDNIGLIFAQGTYSRIPLFITLVTDPGTAFLETTYCFANTEQPYMYGMEAQPVYAEVGKYYYIHPARQVATSPTIGLGLPGFTQGTVNVNFSLY